MPPPPPRSDRAAGWGAPGDVGGDLSQPTVADGDPGTPPEEIVAPPPLPFVTVFPQPEGLEAELPPPPPPLLEAQAPREGGVCRVLGTAAAAWRGGGRPGGAGALLLPLPLPVFPLPPLSVVALLLPPLAPAQWVA